MLIGLFPLAVDLGETRAPAHVLLDGRPVCEVNERSPGCLVDLGRDPRVHLLELVRTDTAGRVTESVRRWVNRPGIEPEVLASGGCDDGKRECAFEVVWAHPLKLDPVKVVLSLDGAVRWQGRGHRAAFPIAKGARPQVVVCDAEFSDGQRATYTRTLYSSYPEEAQASLVAVPIVPREETATADDLVARLRSAGFPARTVEDADPDVTFVMSPSAFDPIAKAMPDRMSDLLNFPRSSATSGSKEFSTVHVVFPGDALLTNTVRLDRLGKVRFVDSSRHSRYADAVAAAGYSLGGAPRRRAVVLVISGFDRENVSTFTAAQARAYLAEVMVPLVVWRIGDVEAPEWPDGPHLSTPAEVHAALEALRAAIDRQRIAWLEGFRDTRYTGRWIAPGVALAGRDSFPVPSPAGGEPSDADAFAALDSAGPDGGPVHALAAGGGAIYAGGHGGVFRSRDLGGRWETASEGLPIGPVRSLAAGPAAETVLAATDAGLYRSRDGGRRWRASGGGAGGAPMASVTVDPSNPRLVFAGTAGRGVLRSDDGGATLLATGLDHGDVRAIAVDPRDHSVVAATESGVFRSADRGLTWSAVASPASRVLDLAVDPDGDRLFAATAGDGLLVSFDRGQSWKRTGLTRSFLTSVHLDPGNPAALLAGSPDGVFASDDAGKTWKLARLGSIEALAFGADGAAFAGSARGILRRGKPGGTWRDASAGLRAQVVYGVAAAPDDGALYAATSTGLLTRRADGSAWAAVSGIPDDVAIDAVAPLGEGSDLYVGTSGSIGRSSQGGDAWSFTSTHATFSFALGASRRDLALAAAREGVLKSVDGGEHWTLAASGMEKVFALQVARDPSNPEVFYAATAGGGVFRSANAGGSWKPGGPELTRRIVRSVAVDPNDDRIVYAGTDAGVFRSGNHGEGWATVSDGLPQASVYALATHPSESGVLFAGTAEGLFRSTNGGTRWSPYPVGGLRAAVVSLWVDPERKELVAGSMGQGVFVLPLEGRGSDGPN